ncbi:BON domain-containing protein [Paraburkholderia sp. Ac-20336]|uniref:BON domain-containing protein n=1 Tax=unclassified Paraburkholderia TaxID=2615204 RepID=UPI001421F6B5|nr:MULTISPECIES: BON domain-containing protein [unclassified Paraburkholderia]MBN3802396.1 BON domain-containing protein [Paraburkholderia sp. Ac-20336]MBN3847473.1 BON domain-containing protein [Paraburkholderia sp. Ac-20342]NIF77436.1 BON domain-containing protein [Paraburkholderia sp. Cy-641]
MNTNGTSSMIGAALVALIASCASYANAGEVMSAPAGEAAHMMTVSASPPGRRSDDAIILDVRRALRRVPDLDDSGIRIRARRGVVTLTGTVPESWQISRAGNAARSVRGVTGVSNRLTERKKNMAAIGQGHASLAG